MAALTKNAISVTVRDRAKRTKIWDHKGYRRQITNIFKNSKFYKKNQNVRLEQKLLSRKQLEIERNGRKFGIIRTIRDQLISFIDNWISSTNFALRIWVILKSFHS